MEQPLSLLICLAVLLCWSPFFLVSVFYFKLTPLLNLPSEDFLSFPLPFTPVVYVRVAALGRGLCQVLVLESKVAEALICNQVLFRASSIM